ncbi:MAG: polymer-forming cytoskeletal protein [Desulfuromonas sp.]|nr:polymer-forming cytoskeletal protein [Desulfuromonas sp.]
MFSKAKKSNPDAITTILGAGAEITGDMSFKETMRIDGQFDGNLSGDNLIVSASGKVLGDVVANSCVCYGQVVGNMKVEKLQVKQGGKIDGTVSTAILEVESGALLSGEIRQPEKELRLVAGEVEKMLSAPEKTSLKK